MERGIREREIVTLSQSCDVPQKEAMTLHNLRVNRHGPMAFGVCLLYHQMVEVCHKATGARECRDSQKQLVDVQKKICNE